MSEKSPKGLTSERKDFKRLLRLVDVLKLAWPYRRTLFLGLLALAVAGGINLAIPEVVRRALNESSLEYLSKHSVLVGGVLAIIFLLQALAFYFRTYWFGVVGHAVVFDLRTRLYESILKKPLAFFDCERTGDLISRLQTDTSALQDVLSIRLSVCIRYLLQVLAGVVLMALLSLKLTSLLLVMVPLLVTLSRTLGKKLRLISKDLQQHLGCASNLAEESFGGIRTVKAFTGEEVEKEKFFQTAKRVRDLGYRRAQFVAFFSSSVNLLMNLSLVTVFMVGLQSVTELEMPAGDLTAFLLYGAIVAISFAFLASSLAELYQATGAAERIFDIFHVPDEEMTGAKERGSPDHREVQTVHSVTVRELTFSYPSRPDHLAVRNMSFSLHRGEFLALVGPSGSGKSTLINLLLRFYNPNSGSILFNDTSITSLSLKDVRNKIGLVPQDPLLFADTIEANIRYSSPNCTEQALKMACEQAAIWEFIQSLPNGLKTYVGERGVQLSGGQKQRIAIARALLREPDIIILDEATSALDGESEAAIKSALSTLRKDKMVIAIAHRLSTIQDADKILVLNRGEIVETGNHEMLLQNNGLYRELVEYQSLTGTLLTGSL